MAASSSASAAVRVEKATSDLLLGPDWTLNIDICDSANSDHGQAKDVIKALKKRLQHKNPKVQFLALTLLETLIKNCGDYVHFQVVERDILQEMMKIVKKKTDMQVRDKILVLLDSWQEAFGGPNGKHPHYYWAYAELKRSGVEFPERSPDAAPIFTPPVTRPASLPTHPQPGYGMPVNSSLRLDEAMASEGPTLSLSDLERTQSAVELLSEMLRVVNPNDRRAVNDEVITELVSQCRSDQKKIMSLVSTVRDEELLGQALDLNDKLQVLLAKHDAIASGSPLPAEVPDPVAETPERVPNPGATVAPQAVVAPTVVPTSVLDDEEEEDDDDEFAQLARRNSKFRPASAESTSSGAGPSSSANHNGTASSAASVSTAASSSVPSNALSLPDPPGPVRTASKEQDIIDLLSLTISSNPLPPHTPVTAPSALNQGNSPVTAPSGQEHSYNPQPYALNQGYAPYNSYVAPWAQPQSQTAGYPQQPPPQSQLPHSSSAYPPPPWAVAPVNPEPRNVAPVNTESNPFAGASSQYSSTANFAPNSPLRALRPLQQSHSFGSPLRAAGSAAGESPMNPNLRQPMSAVSHKPSYVSANRFFDDLIERNADGSLKTSNAGSGVSSPYRHISDNGK